MIDPDDPPRLSEAADPGLRDVLRAARADVGTDAQVARLAQKLGPLLAPVPVAPAPVAAGMGGLAKLGLGALAVCAVGGGIWFARGTAQPAVTAPSHAVVAAPPPVVAPVEASPAPAPEVVAPATQEPAATASVPHEAKATPAPAAKLPEKPTAPAQPSEAELLEQARATLGGDPARALQRANEHAARFPRGVLVQEREVLAIQALRKLGRTAEADRRAEVFVKAFPGSAFARKLQAGQ